MVRVNVDYDSMRSKSATSGTASDTFTREAPNKVDHLRARATIKPAKWVNFAITGDDYAAKNDDPLVNHTEHNHDLSFATTFMAGERFSADLNFAHDSVFSATDLCYVYTATATAPLPERRAFTWATAPTTCRRTFSPGRSTMHRRSTGV